MRSTKPLESRIVKEVQIFLAANIPAGDIKRWIADELEIGFRRAHDYYKAIQNMSQPDEVVITADPKTWPAQHEGVVIAADVENSVPKTSFVDTPKPKEDEKSWQDSLTFNGNYVYNEAEDKYIVYLRTASKHIVVPGERHRSMLRAYSNWDGNPATINEICRNFEFPRAWFIEYKTLMGWTHDREPISNEELKTKNEDEIVDDLLQRKRFAVYQRFQKEDWKATQVDATKWREFQTKQFDPFKEALDSFKPPAFNTTPVLINPDPGASNWFVCGCFDWQVGACADGKYLFRQKEWSTELAKKSIEKFAYQVVYDISTRKQSFKGCEILLGGDLHHGFNGHTVKGTRLEVDTLREDQFDAILQGIVYFIGTMYQVFGKVNVRAVRGNHDGFDFYPVMKAAEAYFRSTPDIKFHIYTTRTAAFRVGPVLLLLDHGASDVYKAPVPRKGKERESYIQSLLLAHPEMLTGVKQKIFIQGDKHHYEQLEFNDFETFMFGALPLGDKYADNLNLHSRPRQNCLLINDNGVKEVLHYYFD